MDKYKVTGMSCAACAARIEKAVTDVNGVTECAVSLLTDTMTVSGSADSGDIIAAVESAGYGASCYTGEITFENDEIPGLRRRFLSSLVFVLILMYISMGHMMWGWPVPELVEDHMVSGIIQMILCTVVMVLNRKFFVSGFSGTANMDTLVSLGSSASYIYSAVMLVMGEHEHLYFESAAMILVLITLGKLLEAISKGRTTDALKGLMELKPQTAHVLSDGVFREVSVSEVREGDVFAVKAGERIPFDGMVLRGTASVDESSLTGESIPADKEEGSDVYEATVNKAGYIECRVLKTGDDTFLSRIISMVADASATKAPVAKLADRVSAVFVPAVIAAACVTFSVWMITGSEFGFALSRGISVLVISCPCALGLATPVAVMAGSGRGARDGILFKNSRALEELGKVKTAVFDKTGTLTEGRPEVTDVYPLGKMTEEELMKLAYSAEINSEHPLAAAVVRAAGETEPYEVSDFEVYPGNGIGCTVNGMRLLAGSMKFMTGNKLVTEEISAIEKKVSSEGKSVLVFALDGTPAGVIACRDKLREDAKESVERLESMGISTVMLTGDNKMAARAAAREAGITHVIPEVLPDMKAEAVSVLRKAGKVMMAGDGINDAPALTAADCGIAVGAGTDIAIDAADTVIMRNSLKDIPAAVALSRRTLTNIRQNLFWAFGYNVVCIPIAAGVFYGAGILLNPMICAAAMSLSSFCVVTNALRLNMIDIYDKSKDRMRKHADIEGILEEISEIMEDDTMKKELEVRGMMCEHCEAAVKNALEAVDGVEKASPDHKKNRVKLKLSKDVSEDTLKNAVKEAGYEA